MVALLNQLLIEKDVTEIKTAELEKQLKETSTALAERFVD